MSEVPRGDHESLPPEDHDEVCVKFFRIVAMEVRPEPHNGLVMMLARGALRQDTATRFLRDLWLRPVDDLYNTTDVNWRARRAE